MTVLARRVPWWLVATIGLACVVLGAVLSADPFRSLAVLAWLVAATLVVSGIAELASSRAASQPWLSRFVGVVWAQVTERFVEQLCAKGETAALQIYPDVGHLETGHDAAPDVVAWTADRFSGEPPTTTCGS